MDPLERMKRKGRNVDEERTVDELEQRLCEALSTLLMNVGNINGELERYLRTEQFRRTPSMLEMLTLAREHYVHGLEVVLEARRMTGEG